MALMPSFRIVRIKLVPPVPKAHHRPCFFKTEVICHSAHPELVIEAVDYGIVGPESRRRLGPARDLGLQFGIMR